MAETLITVEDMIAKMRGGTKSVYDLRAGGLIIPVRILSLDEEIDVRANMIALNNRKSGDQVSLAAMVQKETLKRASFIASESSSMPDRFFDDLRRDELIFIYNEYTKIVEEVNPALDQIKPEQFRAMVEAIKKNSVTANDLSLPQLRAVFIAYQDLIQRLDSQTLPKDNSPGGQS